MYGPKALGASATTSLERLHLVAPRIQFVYTPVEVNQIQAGLTQAVKAAIVQQFGSKAPSISLVSIAYNADYKDVLNAEDKISYVQVEKPEAGQYTSAMLLFLGFSFDADHIPASLNGYVSVVTVVSNGRSFKIVVVRPMPLTNALLELFQTSLHETAKSV